MTDKTKSELENLFENITEFCEKNDKNAKWFLNKIYNVFASETDADDEGVNDEGKIASDIGWILNKPSKF